MTAADPRPRVAIACQGGGSHTAFTAGVLGRLFTDEVLSRYRIVGLSGTSGGAICARLAWTSLVRGEPTTAGRMLRTFWDAAIAEDPAVEGLDERFAVCAPGGLAAAFEASGFDVLEARSVAVPTVFRDFNDYWTPFLGGQGPAPTYCARLSEEGRERLRARLEASEPRHSCSANPASRSEASAIGASPPAGGTSRAMSMLAIGGRSR